jgi:hypothetical protein
MVTGFSFNQAKNDTNLVCSPPWSRAGIGPHGLLSLLSKKDICLPESSNKKGEKKETLKTQTNLQHEATKRNATK